MEFDGRKIVGVMDLMEEKLSIAIEQRANKKVHRSAD